MLKLYALLVALACIPLSAFAEDEGADCQPAGGAMCAAELAGQEQRAAEATLKRKSHELFKLIASSGDDALLADLQRQQVAWLKYLPEECTLVGTLTGAGGSWPTAWAIDCERKHTKQRLRRVQSAIRCIQRISPSERRYMQNSCLEKLAPLTNK
jgi:uncharacterized protein YecT (DUF1311 family)